jgi:HKD family nuclease
MLVDSIDNDGAASMRIALRAALEGCTHARLSTASLTRKGIEFIEDALATGHKNLNIQLLVGLYNGHTEAAALRRLLRMQNDSDGRFEVRIAQNPRFHWKMYLFKNKKQVTAFVGSSNLTSDGLDTEGEFNVRLTGVSGGVLGHIDETFDRAWKKQSVLLDRNIAERFAPLSRQSRDAARGIDPSIRKMLRAPRRKPTKNQPPKLAVRMTFVESFAERTTMKAVADITHWERNGWLWLVFRRRADRDSLQKAGAFYLAELQGAGGLLSLNDVRDDDEIRTEDGKYFVAYQKRKGSIVKRLGAPTLTMLKREGVIKKKDDLRRERTLSRSKCDVLNSLLRVK